MVSSHPAANAANDGTALSSTFFRSASHVIDAYHTPRAVCTRCAEAWGALSPLKRRQARAEFEHRGHR
jgi:hypothetical protein